LKLALTFNYTGRSALTAKEMNQTFREANEAVVEFWHATFIPLHFTDAAMSRYSYQHRSGQDEPEYVPKNFAGAVSKLLGHDRFRMIKNPKYYWAKQRAGKGTTALVFTGASREATKTLKITSSSKQAVGVFPTLSRYFYQYRTDLRDGRTPIDKADELVRVLQDELNAMSPVHEKAVHDRIERLAASDHQTVSIAA
jgi:hypothetical protein